MSSYLNDTFTFNREVYESTIPEDSTSGILRVIKGPVAEWDKLNRNKRKYSEKLWDNVLASPYVQEQLKYHTLFGEANHPEDRYEIDFGRVSHSITELWKVPASEQIFATINILDTPLGRIINTLYEAGGVIGYSSRAGGVLNQKKDFIEVDEKTYNFITFDAVPFPSVETARPNGITEGSEHQSDCTLSDEVHEELCTIIKESGMESRKVIKDFIYGLNWYDMSKEKEVISVLENKRLSDNANKIDDKNTFNGENTVSLLKESSSQINTLMVENQALKATKESLERENMGLKESLNSSLKRVSELVSESGRFDGRLEESRRISNDTIDKLRGQIHELNESIEERDLQIEGFQGLKEACKALEYENHKLKRDISEGVHVNSSEVDTLNEKIEILNNELKEAYSEISNMVKESVECSEALKNKDDEINSISEKLTLVSSERDEIKQSVNESISEQEKLRGSFDKKIESLEAENKKLLSEVQSVNESLDIANKSVGKYKEELLSVICSSYGIGIDSVREHLRVGFTKDDVYSVCEKLSSSIGKGYPTIVEEVSIVTDKKTPEEVQNKSKARDLFGVNRRGI